MDHRMIRSPIENLRFARCIGALAVLVFGSAGVARAAQESNFAPRLRPAEEFVLPRAAAEAGDAIAPESTRAPGPTSERPVSPAAAAYLAANPAPTSNAPQDPGIPHHPALMDTWFIGLGGFFA